MDKPYRWESLTDDGLVSPVPCDISCIVVTSSTSGDARVRVHDGSSASDPLIMYIHGIRTQSKVVNFIPPLRTSRGIYINNFEYMAQILVVYKPVEE